jgi:glycosyltransferase involved in cell wall biosynthesis
MTEASQIPVASSPAHPDSSVRIARPVADGGVNAPKASLSGHEGIVAFVWVDRVGFSWNETLAALLKIKSIRVIHVGLGADQLPSMLRKADPRIVVHDDKTMLEVAGMVQEEKSDFVLFVTWPVRPSPDALDLAIDWMRRDPRIGTMSFLSNSAGSLSFPHRNEGSPFGIDGHDEQSLTDLLRQCSNRAPTPIQVADGAMVLVSRGVLDVCGELEDFGIQHSAMALAELSLRAAKRGFNSYLDSYTYLTVPWDGAGPFESVLTKSESRHALHQRHPHFPGGYDVERNRANSVLGDALNSARAKAMGLRVLIDGSVLGPKEMGTQLLILKLSAALASRPEIQLVALGVPDPTALPRYARELSNLPKVQLIPAGQLDFPGAPDVDIVHRPYQPTVPIPWDRWRGVAHRTVITVQDLIAYRNGAYFQNFEEWHRYRDNFLRQVSQVDAVISISRDVLGVMQEERLPIDGSRIFVIENGADARSKDEPVRIPDAFLKRGWASNSYLFVLGATYAHKNRDLAIRVWARLRAKGFPHKLVMAGANVPFGSTRNEECVATTSELEEHLLVLPDVSSEERNWLMRNSSLAVYLTAAEGFGQVPFEAARMDVPSLFVSFGPLRELIEDPTLPVSYEIDALADRAEALLTDHLLAKSSIAAVLRNIDQLTWAETARKTVDAYFDILGQQSRALVL